MGSSESKPEVVYETVYETITRYDECRPPIMDLAMEHTQDASRKFEDCARKAASDMYMEMNKHQSQVTKDAYQTMMNIGRRMQERSRADAQFCYNIEKKYKPFGIEAPVGLDCQQFEDFSDGCRVKNPNVYDASCEMGKKESPPRPQEKDENGNDIPNVVVIGNTGIGKSYYGNGLMGNLDPNTGYFGTSSSHASCTRGATGVSGYFYGQLLTSYNVEPMMMNFYDTPGFADSDPCQIEKNKERIAATLDKPIHAFILLTDHSNSRINANQKMLFKMLNEWTMGHIWNNLIVSYPRMTFSHDDKMNRVDAETSFLKQLDIKKSQIKHSLWELASDQEWKKRDENDHLVPMEQRDFDNVQVNALNVHQNKVCQFTSDGRIDKRKSDLQRCSQLAYLDDSMDYITSNESMENADNSFKTYSFDSNPFESNPFDFNSNSNFHGRPKIYQVHDDKWIFIEEAKKLQQIIKDFTSHPVTPQKLYWQKKYDIEKAEYAARYKDSEIEFSSKEFKSAGIDTTDCETERNRAMKEIKEYKEAELQKCEDNGW
jgi:hypothetical protein